jgi:hypothetical protein
MPRKEERKKAIGQGRQGGEDREKCCTVLRKGGRGEGTNQNKGRREGRKPRKDLFRNVDVIVIAAAAAPKQKKQSKREMRSKTRH